MNDHVIYTQSDVGLNQFFAKIYSLVGMGVGLSAFVSYLMLYPFRENLISILVNQPMIYYGAAIIELILVFVASGAARKKHTSCIAHFSYLFCAKWLYPKLYYCGIRSNDSFSSISFFSSCVFCHVNHWCQD